MKTSNNKIFKKALNCSILGFSAVTLLFSLQSCQEKPNDYAPALTIGGYTSSDEIASESLIAHWGFNGNLNDTISQTAGTNSGTTFITGVKGQALKGADEAYVVSNTPPNVQTLKSFTVSCWVNSPLNTDGIVGLIDVANSQAFWGNLTVFFENGGTENKGVLKIHVNNNGTDAWLGNYELTSPWNKWMHLAVTYDAASSTFVVYVNGGQKDKKVIAGYGPINFQNASKMVFGTVQFQTTPSLTSATGKQGWAGYLTGALDEVRIYNKALSAEDIGFLQKLEAKGK